MLSPILLSWRAVQGCRRCPKAVPEVGVNPEAGRGSWPVWFVFPGVGGGWLGRVRAQGCCSVGKTLSQGRSFAGP